MSTAMDTPAARAPAYWQEAKKMRLKIIRDIEQLKTGTGGKTEEEQLKMLEKDMAQFRLCFVGTIQHDPQYTFQQEAEDVMWKLHIHLNKAYRDLLHDRLRGQQHVVTRRKVEKLYNNYLMTAQLFYQGYFQRLQALHGMPQIPRINSVLQLEAPQIDERLSVLAPTEAVQKSFHSTLLHLGDLSRWRHKARPKPGSSKMAVLYYDLAHDLKPTSGDAHHQLGMIYTEMIDKEQNHLLVVYHLYRSLAVEHPHGNSTQNLELEFKQLLQSSTPSRRSGPPDPNEAFSNWFVRLHSRFYKGERFPQQVELEEEVLHRLEMMLKKPGTLSLILKMVLINIAAYYVAKSKIEKKWTLVASASCQFILRLNVRWIVVLSRLLQSELQEFSKAAVPAEDDVQGEKAGEKAKSSEKFSAFTDNILPLMRVYVAWLYIYRTDIVNYEEHLGSYIFDMYRAVGQSLTMIAKEFKGEQMIPSPYLLPEDVMALGMKPFDDFNLAPACRLHHAFESDTFKPHWEDRGLPRDSPEKETRSRVYDLMNCGFSLALDELFPLTATLPTEGSNEAIAISYVEGGKASKPAQEVTIGSQTARPDDNIEQLEGHFRSLQSSEEDRPGQQNNSTVNFERASTSATGHHDHEHTRVKSVSAMPQGALEHTLSNRNDPSESESDLSLEAQMHHMVDNLLDEDLSEPTDLHPKRGFGSGTQETSYGMHTATAKEIFGGTQTQGHTASAAFGKSMSSLPWDPFASPSQSGAMTDETATPQQDLTGAFEAGSPSTAQIAPGTSSLRPTVPAFTPGPRLQPGMDLSALFPASNTKTPSSQFGQNSLGFPVRPLSGLSGTLQGGRGDFGHSRQRLGGSTDSSRASSFFSPNDNTSAYKIATGAQNAGRGHTLAKSMSPPLGSRLGNSSLSTTFSQAASGLPPVNSPFGLPAAQIDGTVARGDMYSYLQQSGPMASSALYTQSNNLSTVCNGHVYDATTSWGRGPIATKDDPTHFRNAVKKTHMAAAVAEADAFDRAILESALVDDHPRPKR